MLGKYRMSLVSKDGVNFWDGEVDDLKEGILTVQKRVMKIQEKKHVLPEKEKEKEVEEDEVEVPKRKKKRRVSGCGVIFQ